jgi:hypothetical protein
MRMPSSQASWASDGSMSTRSQLTLFAWCWARSPASALAEPSSLTMVTCGFSSMKGW